MSRTISFMVSDEFRLEADAFANKKGFRTASDLARYALVQHMKRYPVCKHGNGTKGLRAVQPQAQEGNTEASL
jgi:hypothetical protein